MKTRTGGVTAFGIAVGAAGAAWLYWVYGLVAMAAVVFGLAVVALSLALHREKKQSTHLDRALGRESARVRRVSDHAWHSELLGQVVAELRSSPDDSAVLQAATSALGAALQASRVVVYGRDPDNTFRARSQFVVEGVAPLATDASLPAILVSDPALAHRLSQSEPFGDRPPELRALTERLQARSAVVARAGEHSIMVTTDQADAARSWTDDERRLIQRFADGLGDALARDEQHRDQRENAEVHASLVSVARALSGARDVRAVAEIATSAGVRLTPARATAVLVGGDDEELHVVAQSGFERGLSPESVGSLDTALEDALRTRSPIRLDGCALPGRWADRTALGAVLIVPLHFDREAMGVLLLDKNPSEGVWQGFDIDIAQKLAQLTASSLKNASLFEALSSSEAHYIDLCDNAPDLHQTIDVRGRILDSNRTQCLALGYAKEDLDGSRFESLLAKESVPSWRKVETELFDTGYVRDVSLRLRAREGRSVDVLVNASVVRAKQGQPLSARLVMRDVSDLRRIEHQLRQSQKLEVVGTLAGGIAHDFNNLLSGILGYASLLKSHLGDRPHARRYVDTIERSAVRGAELTGRLLAASRKTPAQSEAVNINQVVEETLELLSHTFDKKVRIGKRLDPAVRPVLADAGQFQQVVLNLCVNARDAMADGGLLRIETEVDELEKRLRLSVEDSGVGMDPSTIERLFEPFFSTKGERGTGLGLSVVYEIIKSLDGEIRVKSSPGNGARFDIFVPAMWVDEHDQLAEPAPPLRGQGELVLLVDDERVLRELGKDILESHGYRVQAVGSGEEALAFMRNSGDAVALVILDLVMPGLDGGETYRRLRDVATGVPVLLSSGLSSEEAVAQILADGASGFIPKPYGIGELTHAVRSAIENDDPPLMH